MTITAAAIYFFLGCRRITWQRVAVGLLVDDTAAAAASHNDVIAATLAGAAAGVTVNRDANVTTPVLPART